MKKNLKFFLTCLVLTRFNFMKNSIAFLFFLHEIIMRLFVITIKYQSNVLLEITVLNEREIFYNTVSENIFFRRENILQ